MQPQGCAALLACQRLLTCGLAKGQLEASLQLLQLSRAAPAVSVIPASGCPAGRCRPSARHTWPCRPQNGRRGPADGRCVGGQPIQQAHNAADLRWPKCSLTVVDLFAIVVIQFPLEVRLAREVLLLWDQTPSRRQGGGGGSRGGACGNVVVGGGGGPPGGSLTEVPWALCIVCRVWCHS